MQATVKMLPEKVLSDIKPQPRIINNFKMSNIIWTDTDNLETILTTKSEAEQPRPSISILDLGKMLLQYAKDGDVERVHDLIGKGAPFSADWLGMTALHFAAKQNHYEICEMLLRGGINKDAKTKVDRTPLHYAVYEGHEKIVELLLSRKCDVNIRDMLKMTALHWAVEKRHKSIARLLLKHGADVTIVSKFDKSPVTIAVQTGQADLLHELEQARQNQKNRENLLFDMQQNQSETNDAVNSIALDTPTFDLSSALAENDNISEEIIATSDSNSKQLDASALQILKNHGISMLPADDPENNMLTSALQSGRKLVLSEAGKLVLNETKLKKPEQTSSSGSPNMDKKNIDNSTMKVPKKPPILVRAKTMPLKSTKNLKIITMDMFKQMYGNGVVDHIKKYSNLPKPQNVVKPLTGISKITKITALNSTTGKKQILHKVNFKDMKDQQNLNSSTSSSNQSPKMEVDDEDELPPNIIEVCSDSEIEDEKFSIPQFQATVRKTYSSQSKNLPTTVKTVSISSKSNTDTNDTEIPILDIAEISRQLYELRKQTEELQKQLELSQKQSEEYKIRLERLEKERERHENYS